MKKIDKNAFLDNKYHQEDGKKVLKKVDVHAAEMGAFIKQSLFIVLKNCIKKIWRRKLKEDQSPLQSGKTGRLDLKLLS